MAILKVSQALFSPYKTITKALQKAEAYDAIELSAGSYEEQLAVTQQISLSGTDTMQTMIGGTFVITKSGQATMINLSFHLNTQLIIEGEAYFENCCFDGRDTTAICAIDGGKATFVNCTFSNAKEIGLYVVNDSDVLLQHCTFGNSRRAHILCEGAHMRIEHGHFSNAQHALWLKSSAAIYTKQCTMTEHSGTQIIVQHAYFTDNDSHISHGGGNGLFADGDSAITLQGTTWQSHTLPQLWLKQSELTANDCTFERGSESAIMLMQHATAAITHCQFDKHRLAMIQVFDHSRLHVEHCELTNCEGYGVQLRHHAIANFAHTQFNGQTLAQLHITDQSIASLNNSQLTHGRHVALHIENRSVCDLVQTTITDHPNSAIILLHSDCNIFDSRITHSKGNGLLALDSSHVKIEDTYFADNEMPHIAAKHDVHITIVDSHFERNKAIYALKNCQLELTNTRVQAGDGVQIELLEETRATLSHCQIDDGQANAIKASQNCTVTLAHCQIRRHALPQVVINNSSLICQDSELLDGAQNGFIIENESDAFIQHCFIAQHGYPQLWISDRCNVDIVSSQIKDGTETAIFVQNNCAVLIEQSVIQHNQLPYTIQAFNHSNIDIQRSSIANVTGNTYYSENNSSITETYDEVDY